MQRHQGRHRQNAWIASGSRKGIRGSSSAAQAGVVVVGGGGISRVHPALARKMRVQGRWHRPRGQHFRLEALPGASPGNAQCHAGIASRVSDRLAECATTAQAVSEVIRGHRMVTKVLLYGTGPLRLSQQSRHGSGDGRILRGALLKLLREHLGEDAAFALSNHDTFRKSPIAVGVSRRNDRRGFLTILAEQDASVLTLIQELVRLLRDHPLSIGDGGPGTREVRVRAEVVQWEARGVYLDVTAKGRKDAQKLVPSSLWARAEHGRAGKSAEYVPYRVRSRRQANLPVQVGRMGSYGYGVLT